MQIERTGAFARDQGIPDEVSQRMQIGLDEIMVNTAPYSRAESMVLRGWANDQRLAVVAPKIPEALVVVVIGIAATVMFGLGDRGVDLNGDVPRGLSSFVLPDVGFIVDNFATILGGCGRHSPSGFLGHYRRGTPVRIRAQLPR